MKRHRSPGVKEAYNAATLAELVGPLAKRLDNMKQATAPRAMATEGTELGDADARDCYRCRQTAQV
jgi:hypothetical protein